VLASGLMASRLLLATLSVLALHAATAETGFLNRTVTVQGTVYRYVVYVPNEWTAQKKWPVILSLHGSIERGDDGVQQSLVGLGRAVREHPVRFPAVIVMPQCRPDTSWEAEAMEAQALASLDASSAEFNGDPDRTYLTGFSMGGYGTWQIAARHPERFAALIVICGGILWPPSVAMQPLDPHADSPYARTALSVAKIPVWVFHGDADQNVPVTESRRMVNALKVLKADVKYTEYKGVSHFMWDRAYNEPDLPPWLFEKRRHPTGSARVL
jgi:predicted peptidase